LQKKYLPIINKQNLEFSLILEFCGGHQTTAGCRPLNKTTGLSSNSQCHHKDNDKEEKRYFGFLRTEKIM
uniref:Uncharacterized protein n=1 Tax=Equus asinus asinus TaxID=83772 RepID=A0A8C4L9L5_EQUAS